MLLVYILIGYILLSGVSALLTMLPSTMIGGGVIVMFTESVIAGVMIVILGIAWMEALNYRGSHNILKKNS